MASITIVKCPACGAPMTKRNGRLGEFYGCSRYPKCTKSMDVKDAIKLAQTQAAAAQPQAAKTFVPSKYQQAVFDFISQGKGNAFVKARAGSGKCFYGLTVED